MGFGCSRALFHDGSMEPLSPNLPSRTRMKPAPHDPVIAAAAELLVERPEARNSELLQRLARRLGPEVARQIPVNRFQRHVREPALALLRRRELGVVEEFDSPGPITPASGVEQGAEVGRDPVAPPGSQGPRAKAAPRRSQAPRHQRARKDEVEAASVDRALLEAFELGVEAGSPGEIVEGFRRLDEVRLKVRKTLLGAAG